MFFEALMSLSKQHNLHSLVLQRITLWILDILAMGSKTPFFFLRIRFLYNSIGLLHEEHVLLVLYSSIPTTLQYLRSSRFNRKIGVVGCDFTKPCCCEKSPKPTRPFDYLKEMLYMNEVLEKQESKLFQPLPLRNNIVPKHIILDTASLVSLFCPANKTDGIKKGELHKNLKENQHDIWNAFLNLNHKIFRNQHYQFHHQIQTDGVSCCLLFIRKDLKDKKWGSRVPSIPEQDFYGIEDLSKEQLDTLKDRNIVGCDPGKHSLVYMMDKNGKKLQYTASQRKIERYGKRNQRILLQEKKKHKIIEKETHLSFQNSKSVDYENFKTYLVEKNKLNKEVGEFYRKETWRKMKFRQYSYGKKSIDTFLNKIQEIFGSNILIGYGNWSRDTQMKHFMPTMNKGLRKQIHKRYDTITINEFNTSKKCCDCYNEMKHYRDKNNKEVYRLFVCSNCVSCQNKQNVFRTRDANSAVNIMNLTTCWIKNQTRPEEFSRASSFTCLGEETRKSKTIVVKAVGSGKHNY
jgi:hypothetical protein